MGGCGSRIAEGPGGSSQLRFCAVWAGIGEGEEGRLRCYYGFLPAVSQRVEDGGSRITGDAACATVGEGTRWGWEFRVLLKGPQISPLRYAPDFLWKLVALASTMRLSLRKGARAALSNAARQEIRVRSGRDDNSV